MNVAARMYKALKQEDGITRVIREDREVVHHSQSVHASVVSLDAAGFGSTACCAHFRVCRRSSSMAWEPTRSITSSLQLGQGHGR